MKLFMSQKSNFSFCLFNLVSVQQRSKRRKWIFTPVSPMKKPLCFPWPWLRLIAKSSARDSSCRLQSPIWTKSKNEDVMGGGTHQVGRGWPKKAEGGCSSAPFYSCTHTCRGHMLKDSVRSVCCNMLLLMEGFRQDCVGISLSVL